MLGNTISTALYAGLENISNRLLSLDPASRQKLQALNGKVFAIQCTAPELNAYLLIVNNQLELRQHYESDPDTRLSGSLDDFRRLLEANDVASELINGNIQLQGDSQALMQLQKILHQLDIDWEAALAKQYGDVVGHGVGQLLRRGASHFSTARLNFQQQVEDYIVHESEWLAPRWQIDDYNRQVDELRARTERLEARFKRWQQSQRTTNRPSSDAI